jgi:uncharacterized membrane protein
MIRVLLVGESWSTTSIHTKGFDSFTTVHYAEGGGALIKVLLDSGFGLTYMQSHIAAGNFPFTVEELNAYDVILLSDIGSNTFLLPGSTFLSGNPSANRLSVIKQWVKSGGGFGMIGGYLSFQGIEAKANYRNTVISEILPILMEEGDDREETPEGSRIEVTGKHQITSVARLAWLSKIHGKTERSNPCNGKSTSVLGGWGFWAWAHSGICK